MSPLLLVLLVILILFVLLGGPRVGFGNNAVFAVIILLVVLFVLYSFGGHRL